MDPPRKKWQHRLRQTLIWLAIPVIAIVLYLASPLALFYLMGNGVIDVKSNDDIDRISAIYRPAASLAQTWPVYEDYVSWCRHVTRKLPEPAPPAF
ncbi:MAG: hypothetical protein HKN23_09775 [Verrucomicrobiales bacterium]|nr:hypothetical protein [Verrucomicrobiales bacterium]